jgi:hypothetical protein
MLHVAMHRPSSDEDTLDAINSSVFDSEMLSFSPRLVLEEVRSRDVDAGAGVLANEDTQATAAEVSRGKETADVRRQAADHDRRDPFLSQQRDEAGVLSRQGVCIDLTVEALAPDGMKAIGVQPREELGPGRSPDAVRRVEIVTLAEKTAMVRRMPVLAGVDAPPIDGEEPIHRANDGESTGYWQLNRAELCEATLGIHDEQGGRCEGYGFHDSWAA